MGCAPTSVWFTARLPMARRSLRSAPRLQVWGGLQFLSLTRPGPSRGSRSTRHRESCSVRSEKGEAQLTHALDIASTMLAAEMIGGAQACLDMSVAYAKVREQFGRTIGSFQAVKHKCAEVLVGVEGARSAVNCAAWAASASPGALAIAAPLAKAATSEAFYRGGGEGPDSRWHRVHMGARRASVLQAPRLRCCSWQRDRVPATARGPGQPVSSRSTHTRRRTR